MLISFRLRRPRDADLIAAMEDVETGDRSSLCRSALRQLLCGGVSPAPVTAPPRIKAAPRAATAELDSALDDNLGQW